MAHMLSLKRTSAIVMLITGRFLDFTKDRFRSRKPEERQIRKLRFVILAIEN